MEGRIARDGCKWTSHLFLADIRGMCRMLLAILARCNRSESIGRVPNPQRRVLDILRIPLAQRLLRSREKKSHEVRRQSRFTSPPPWETCHEIWKPWKMNKTKITFHVFWRFLSTPTTGTSDRNRAWFCQSAGLETKKTVGSGTIKTCGSTGAKGKLNQRWNTMEIKQKKSSDSRILSKWWAARVTSLIRLRHD